MRYTVEKVEKLRTFFVLTGFPNSLRFKNNFRNTKLSFRQFVRFGTVFCRHFQTACRIDANDTPLKSYGYCAHLLSVRVSQIPYSFKTILEIVHSVFTFFPISYCFLAAISKPLVGLMQMIRRWKAMKNAQLFYL